LLLISSFAKVAGCHIPLVWLKNVSQTVKASGYVLLRLPVTVSGQVQTSRHDHGHLSKKDVKDLLKSLQE
jgi:hypothetical protein